MESIAYLYARFSTKRQEDGDSLERQTLAAQEWCARNSVKLSDKTFEDLGVSAFKEGTRPALSEFIQVTQTGRVHRGSFLLVEDDDRLSRRGWKVTQDLMHELVNLGITVVLLKTGRKYDADNIHDIGDNIILMVNADRAYKESERKSHLIRAQRKRARENRKVTGKLPAWIVRADTETGFDFNDKISVIRELIEVRSQGHSFQYVAKQLNAKNYTTGTGAKWSASGVRSIIQNHALYGAKAYFDTDKSSGRMNKHPIDIALDVFPLVINFEQWLSLQQKSKTGKGGRTSKRGAYSQLLRCGNCGSGMVQRTTTYKDQKRLYRKCISAVEGKCTQVEAVREPEIYLDKVLKDLTYKVIESGFVSKTPELKQQLETLEKTQDILIQNGMAEQLADLYVKMNEIKSLIDKSMEADRKSAEPVETSFSKILDIHDSTKRNIELRKLLDSVTFVLHAKVKTRSQWHVIIKQMNGYETSFLLDQKHGFGNTKIKFVANQEKLAKLESLIPEMEPWEQ
ncbi:recombinase family protein [Vibrio parahaemolyticus]|uniref:recombinase family protein n=1 Tax=Vibrio parahaemolyticus TaxID=670 RepID=UPI0007A07314|nr:recombinase family protein [Vibrio parahaemolyticus]KYZ16224.1 hypothetical protein AW039_02350 [Vibrio parahaemolyticus]